MCCVMIPRRAVRALVVIGMIERPTRRAYPDRILTPKPEARLDGGHG